MRPRYLNGPDLPGCLLLICCLVLAFYAALFWRLTRDEPGPEPPMDARVLD